MLVTKVIFLIFICSLLIAGSNSLIAAEGAEVFITDRKIILLEEKINQKKRARPKYQIKLKYPKFTIEKVEDSLLNKINTSVKEVVLKKQIEFLDYSYNSFDMKLRGAQTDYWVLSNKYEVFNDSKNIISILFEFEYLAGGAHQRKDIESLNIQISPFKILTTHDIVRQTKMQNLLEKLCSLSRKYLITQNSKNIMSLAEKQWIFEGTIPNMDNYNNIVFSEEGLLLVFPTYQVGSYSKGTIKINISKQEVYNAIVDNQCSCKQISHSAKSN